MTKVISLRTLFFYEIDDEYFEKRKLIWREALPTGIPSNDGFIFSLTSSKDINFFYNRDNVFQTIPYEDRIKKNTNVILDMVFNKRFEKEKIKKENIISVYLDKYEKFKTSNEYKHLRKKVEMFLRNKLSKDYSKYIGTSVNLSETNYKYIVKE